MKRFLLYFLLSISASAIAQQHLSPQQTYPGLFEQVQSAGIYPDSKTFPDAFPKRKPADILKSYMQEKTSPTFNLKEFVQQNFIAPGSHTAVYTSNISAGIEKHLDTLWTVLKRNPDSVSQFSNSLIPLPKAYIVPGGRFREIYYWDSYFTMLGLQTAGKTQVIKDMVDNFSYLIRTIGFIPNGNRTYYLTRSQPPFFSLMVDLLVQSDPTLSLKDYRPVLEREYEFWMKGSGKLSAGKALNHVVKLKDGSILNRYYDAGSVPREESYIEDVKAAALSKQKPADFYRNVRSAAESGWDFSTRWFADGKTFGQIITTDLIPVDLNALLYHLEESLGKAYAEEGNAVKAKAYQLKANNRKKALLRYCWNSQKNTFTDYNWKLSKPSEQVTLAAAMPLFFKLATANQAKAVAIQIENKFLKSGGLITTLNASGQQWDAPNAWAPLQWIAYTGLQNYGYVKLSDTLAERWIGLNTKVFNETGKLMEKYDVSGSTKLGGGGEYPLQDGFGWTNGVLLRMMQIQKSPRLN